MRVTIMEMKDKNLTLSLRQNLLQTDRLWRNYVTKVVAFIFISQPGFVKMQATLTDHTYLRDTANKGIMAERAGIA